MSAPNYFALPPTWSVTVAPGVIVQRLDDTASDWPKFSVRKLTEPAQEIFIIPTSKTRPGQNARLHQDVLRWIAAHPTPTEPSCA